MFSFTNKKSKDFCKFWSGFDEEDLKKKFQRGIADVLLLNVLDRVLFFLNLSKQFNQNACKILFRESFYLKYGIYKPQEVKNHMNSFLYRFSPPSVYKSHILIELLINSI